MHAALGVTFRLNISCILRKAYYRLRQLFPFLNESSTIYINLAVVIYKSVYVYIYRLHTFQNKVLRIITKLPRVTAIVTLHEQTGMSLARNHIKKLARTLYRKSVTSENCQIQELGLYDLIGGKYLRPLSLLARYAARCGDLK
jgi:hypothetical protein